jgi:hypothetical protein
VDVTLCVQYVLRRVGLQLNISVSIRQWKTFGPRVVGVRCVLLKTDLRRRSDIAMEYSRVSRPVPELTATKEELIHFLTYERFG